VDDARQFGLPGVTMEPWDHICAVYVGARERNEILTPYLRAGLEAGDKCICVVDAGQHRLVRDEIGEEIDVDGCIASQQLELLNEIETYLRTGRFALEDMIEYWNGAVGTAVSGGRFRFARAVGDTTWVRRVLGGFDEFAAYESELNGFAPRYPQAILCLYDLQLSGGGVLVDLLKTHPKVLLGGMVLENPHYLSPDEFRASRP
jgi:hypothetical protein